MQKLLRFLLLAGIFIIPFTPLVITPSLLFPFISGKGFFFRIIIEALVGIWLILTLVNREYRPRFSPLLVAGGAFLGVLALANILGENPLKSFLGGLERMEGFVMHLHLFAFLLIAGSVLTTERLWNVFFHVSLGVSILIGLYGLLQLGGYVQIFTDAGRIDGTFGNASHLATYMLLHTFLTAFLLVRWRGRMLGRYLYGATLLLQVIILFFTGTRSSFIGLLGGAVVTAILILLLGKREKLSRRMALVGITLVLTLGSGFLLIRDTEFIKTHYILARFTKLSPEHLKEEGRYHIWQVAFEGVKERPLLGWGQENFILVFNTFYRPELYKEGAGSDRAHNILLDWLIAAGTVGVVAYVVLFAVAISALWSSNKVKLIIPEKSLLTGLLAGYFINNLFIFDTPTSYILYFSLLAYLYAASTHERFFERDPSTVVAGRRVSWVIYALITGVTTIFIYVGNVEPLTATVEVVRAREHLAEHKAAQEETAVIFSNVLSQSTFVMEEIRRELLILATNISRRMEVKRGQRILFDLARREAEKQIAIQPKDVRWHHGLGVLLREYGEYNAALIALTKARELSPRKQVILFDIGYLYLDARDYEKAYTIFMEALALAPQFDRARILAAAGAIYTGREELVEELNPNIYLTFGDRDPLVQSYFDTGRINRVIDILNRRISSDPNNPQLHISLAAAYFEAGDREQSITIIEEVMERHPNFRTQGNYYIQEIRAGRKPTE